MGISTLKNHLAALEESGLIEVVRKFAEGVALPNQYMLKIGGVGQNLTEGQPESDRGVGQNLATNQELKPVIEPVAAQWSASKRGTRLPEDWKLPKHLGEWALKEFPQWSADDVRTEADKFRDFWVAKTGKDASKADWDATWRNWCRNSRTPQGKSNQPSDRSELFRGAI